MYFILVLFDILNYLRTSSGKLHEYPLVTAVGQLSIYRSPGEIGEKGDVAGGMELQCNAGAFEFITRLGSVVPGL
jgi:hypothetical protein